MIRITKSVIQSEKWKIGRLNIESEISAMKIPSFHLLKRIENKIIYIKKNQYGPVAETNIIVTKEASLNIYFLIKGFFMPIQRIS